MSGVQRQRALRQLQRKQSQKANDVESQQRHRIALPAHFLLRLDARQPINAHLDRSQQAGQPRAVAAGRTAKDARHIAAQQRCAKREQDEIKKDLYIL